MQQSAVDLRAEEGLTFDVRLEIAGEEVSNLEAQRPPHKESWSHVTLEVSLEDGEADWLDIYTDSQGTGDADYLVGGLWLQWETEDHQQQSNPYGVFAFMDGSDHFNGNIGRLSGTATYRGDAFGMLADSGGNKSFEADVELTASFGDSTALGTIEGSVSAFELNGEPSEDIGVLTLASADIGDSESGFFTGDTTLAGTAGFEGEWGGRFFGNGESDGQPGSVAGTFGAASSDGNASLLGVFGAYRQ